MAPVYADHPYELIQTPKFQASQDEKGSEPDMFCRVASEMAVVHNMVIRGLNSIYLQAPYVSHAESKYFVKYMLAWYSLLHVHHSGEETDFFPAIEDMSGEKGLMECNVSQHKKFHDGIESFKTYIDACASGKEKFDGEKVVTLIAGFGEVLTQHLRDEITTLLDLRKHGLDKMGGLEEKFGIEGERNMKELGLVVGLPFCFSNHDLGYEDGLWSSWPPAPNIVKLLCRHVMYRFNSKRWKFAACDRMGNLQPLYAVPE
ncbi:uncharacterized protein CTRU02_210204 [Colletotrichum truncatum]|uniref:Uncharacterized protein n=1 Tax=Colletotrichum truncatum TaxID=5467 RepID=A0ACC3YUJ1_COLTU|nr:uncharacterized protein CTRU02_11413 [Colletotrichum truncatum]KAF6785788.1 hypothetical protein CTRU02_11413 [Colletotrichum truncatum]